MIEENTWISVKNRLPSETGEAFCSILVAVEGDLNFIEAFYDANIRQFLYMNLQLEIPNVTYWMYVAVPYENRKK